MPRSGAAVELLADLDRVLKRRRIRWYVFGAQASVYYGRPRMTADVDVTVSVSRDQVAGLVAAMRKAGFEPRVTDLDEFVARARVIPFMHRRTMMPLDLVLAGDVFEGQFLDRARRVDIGGARVPMISPEDLIVTKLVAGRPHDLDDVRGVVAAVGDRLDVEQIRSLLREIESVMEDADLLGVLERLLARQP